MYCRECGATLPEDANFCPKCGSRVISEKRPVETHRTMKVSGKPKLIITNIAPGSIEVKSGSKGQVTVDLDLRNPENLDFDSSQEGDTITITCRSLLSSWIWPSYIFGVGPRANIYLTVPAKADLELETSAGRISVTGVKGNMVAESSAGAIRYSDCEGTIRSRTNAGSIRLRNVNAIVSARSSAGSIRFSGALLKGENWFKTSVGSLELTLQGEPDLTVEASTSLGRVSFVPELTDGLYRHGRYTGRIGEGSGRLIIETKTGSITVRR